MIHPYDSAVQMPNMDLYDTNMMQLYINAVQREYERGFQDQKEFLSKYGDFFSPFAKDVQNWDAQIMGPVMDMVDAFYKQGIDPARNPEARAMLQAQMRKIPYAQAAAMKYNAKMGEEYLKNMGQMMAKGLYNPDREAFALAQAGLTPFDQFDSSKGMWTRTSPIENKTLFENTHEWFEKEQPYELSEQEVRDFGLDYDSKRQYVGISRQKLKDSLVRNIPGWMGTEDAAYYRAAAEKELKREGIENPTGQEIMDRLMNNILAANAQYIRRPVSALRDDAKMEMEYGYDLKKIAAHAKYVGRYKSQDTDKYTIFDFADAYPGQDQDYVSATEYAEAIVPENNKVVQNENVPGLYEIHNFGDGNHVVYRLYEGKWNNGGSGSIMSPVQPKDHKGARDVKFSTTGRLRKVGSHYYMQGILKTQYGTPITYKDGSTLWIRVRESYKQDSKKRKTPQ